MLAPYQTFYDRVMQPTATEEPWRDIVRRAIGILKTEGWTQNHMLDETGYCVAGAINKAAYGNALGPIGSWHTMLHVIEAFERIEAEIGILPCALGGGLLGLAYWNDNAERTVGHVVGVLERTLSH